MPSGSWRELRGRFAKVNLELHPDKTRLLEFGPSAADDRRRAGLGKPETFNCLGFTHICGKTRKGRFTVLRQTVHHDPPIEVITMLRSD